MLWTNQARFAALAVAVVTFVSFSKSQEIRFPEDPATCTQRSGRPGICRNIQSCPSEIHKRPVPCGFEGRSPLVCCPPTTTPNEDFTILHVTAPEVDFDCGDSTPLRVLERSKRSAVGPLTAQAKPTERTPEMPVIGGFDARIVRTKYMALLGDKDSNGFIDWFCDGVLINEQWVLTAAHCLDTRHVNVVRLGEYDHADDLDGAHPEDFEVLQTINYPQYKFPQAYHDLALIKLAAKVFLPPDINPVCLPWGQQAEKNLLGQRITLTGWGATEHGGLGSSVLQEVDVTVFPPSRCDQSYSTLFSYSRQWPEGIGNETVCAGDPKGKKDACQGDSGGPVVYKDEENRFVLVGIVSKGYGCGLQKFPGLYVNIGQTSYLTWIKQVAFNNPI